MLDDNKWFEYVLFDAWYRPLTSVTVLKADKNIVIYGVPDKQFTNLEPQKNIICTLEISDLAMDKIKSVLNNDSLFMIENLESPIYIDGYIHKFYFCDGKYHVELTGSNIEACRGEYEKYPCAAMVIDILKKLEEILVPEGVDQRCFMLVEDIG